MKHNRVLKKSNFDLLGLLEVRRGVKVQNSSPLCSLFNQSLSLGIVPDIWKEAHVCPIPKGRDRTAV